MSFDFSPSLDNNVVQKRLNFAERDKILEKNVFFKFFDFHFLEEKTMCVFLEVSRECSSTCEYNIIFSSKKENEKMKNNCFSKFYPSSKFI